MVAGAIFLVLQLIMLADGLAGYSSEAFNVMTAITVVAMASIVWLAFRWPRGTHEVLTPVHDGHAETDNRVKV